MSHENNVTCTFVYSCMDCDAVNWAISGQYMHILCNWLQICQSRNVEELSLMRVSFAFRWIGGKILSETAVDFYIRKCAFSLCWWMCCYTQHCYNANSDSIAKIVLFAVMSVCGCVCVSACFFVTAATLEPFEVSSWILWEQDMVNISEDFENCCILMQWQIRQWCEDLCLLLLDNPGCGVVFFSYAFHEP